MIRLGTLKRYCTACKEMTLHEVVYNLSGKVLRCRKCKKAVAVLKP